MKEFHGIYPSLITPFDRKGNLNGTVVQEIVDWHVQAGVDGFYICGGTGEGLLLTPEERKLMTEQTVSAVDGRVKVIVHVGDLATQTSMDLARHAQASGVDAISSIPPIFYRVDRLAMKDHYALLASASNLPFFVYHIPARTGLSMGIQFMRELIAIQNIRGIKFSDYDLFTLHQIVELSDDLVVYSGNDQILMPALTMGATGGIGLTYNFMPQIYVGIYQAFRSGNFRLAQDLQSKACKMIEAVVGVYEMAVAKAALEHLGFDVGEPRRPLRPLTDCEKGIIFERMDQLELAEGVPR